MKKIVVMTLDLPMCVRGATAITDDGKYHICINRHYDLCERKSILKEELEKINGLDIKNSNLYNLGKNQEQAI